MDSGAAGNLDSTLGQKLTPRESDLVRQAGERVFALSRRLAEAEKEAQRLASTNEALRELLEETRRSRDILSAQVSSLQAERDREYEERAELRRLLASLHMQVQELLPSITAALRAQIPAELQRPVSLPPVPDHSSRAGPARLRPQATADGASAAEDPRRAPRPSLSSRLVTAARRELGLPRTVRRR